MLHHKGLNKITNVLAVLHLNCDNKRKKVLEEFQHKCVIKRTKGSNNATP